MNERIEIVKKYMMENIRPIYAVFDYGHDVLHFDEVFEFGMDTHQRMNNSRVDPAVLMACLAMHDVGRLIDKEDHEIHSIKAVEMNFFIKSMFTKDEIHIIKQAIYEHRSSRKASSLYAMILKDADKIPSSELNRKLYRIMGYNYCHHKDEGLGVIIKSGMKRLKKSGNYTPVCGVNKDYKRVYNFNKVTEEDMKNVLFKLLEERGIENPFVGEIYPEKIYGKRFKGFSKKHDADKPDNENTTTIVI